MQFPLFKVHIPINDAIVAIRNVFESGYLNEGIEVTRFRDSLASFLDEENIVLMNSCTSALTVAYKLSGVEPGTEVITTAMTCIASNTPIINLGAKIVWADIDPESGSINPYDIEKKITEKTRAISYVDWAGNPAELERILDIGRRYDIKIVQDAAHAFGAKWKNKSISKYADFTCYSFQAIKHLSTGDGGMLICADSIDFQLAKKLKWFGYDRDATKDEKGDWKGQRWEADIEKGEIGFKFNMNNINAAIGLAQMQYIEKIIKKHQANALIYQEQFKDFKLIKLLKIPKESISANWVFTVLTEFELNKRNELLEKLNDLGIGVGLVHLPNDKYSAFQDYLTELPGVRDFESHQMSIPCGWWLDEKDCLEIASTIKKVMIEMAK